MKRTKEIMRGKVIRKNALFLSVMIASFVYFAWRLLFTLPFGHGAAAMFWGILLLVAEGDNVVETFSHFYNARHVKIPEMPVIPRDMYPDVDVLICTHNETEELLYKTLNGCNHMHYPDKSKVHVYLCDDTGRPGAKALAERMGAGYVGFTWNRHAKAGNLNYALTQTGSPFVAVFDADMIPTSDFLMETVPYFFAREMIKRDGRWRRRGQDEPSREKPLGYVQTRQSFYNPDPLQRNLFMEKHAPNEQDYFYRAINVARTNTGSAAFAGSNTVFSRKALEDAGGLATYSITEDLATSISILDQGYHSIAVDKELAHGLSPEDAHSFIKQRQRWSRGSSQVIPTLRFFRSRLSLKAKWNFIVSYFYWWTFARRMIFILCPILYGVFGIAVADVSFQTLIAVWLPYYIIYNAGMRMMSGGTINSLWSSIVDTIQFPYLIWPIIAGTLKIPEKKFWVTPKDKVKGKNSSLRLAIPHIILAVLSLVAAVKCMYDVFVIHYDGAIIVLFWLAYNLFALANAVVYYNGRSNQRNYERIMTPLPVALYPDGRVLNAMTGDLSEGGLSVLFDTPEYLPYEKDFAIQIADRDYRADLTVRVRQVQQMGSQWKYGLMITHISEADKSEYMQILYDRAHLFSSTVDLSVSKNIHLIYSGLRAKPVSGKRLLPRIDMNVGLPAPETDTGSVVALNFNYKYLLVKGEENLPDQLTLHFPDDRKITCIKDSHLRPGADPLYRVVDWEKLAVDPKFRAQLLASSRRTLQMAS